MINWAQKQAAHGRTIARTGLSATLSNPPLLRRLGVPVNGIPSSATPTDYPISVLITEYSDEERANSLIVQDDRKAAISAAGLAVIPVESDLIVVPEPGGIIVYSIVRLEAIQPGGITIRYTAQIRI